MATAALRRAMTALTRPSDPTDADLLRQFAESRSEAAFTALVRRHGPLVFGVCRRVVPDRHLADDAFQAAFVVLARRAAGIDPTRPLGPWLYGVAHRVALRARTMLGKRRKRETLAAAVPDTPRHSPAVDDAAAVLDEEIAKLPDATRDAVILCELQGLSRREAAKRLGITEGTLSSRLAAARKTLAVKLRSRGVVLSAALAGAVVVSPELATAAVAAGTGVPLNSVVASLADGASAMTLLNKLKLSGMAMLFLLLSAGGIGPWGVNQTSAAPVPKQAPDGVFLVCRFNRTEPDKLVEAFDPSGQPGEYLKLGELRDVRRMRLSPDGKRLAFTTHRYRKAADTPALFNFEESLYVVDLPLAGPPKEPLLKNLIDPSFVWAADSKTLFLSRVPAGTDLRIGTVKGKPVPQETVRFDPATGKEEAVKLPDFHKVQDLSADGKTLLTRTKTFVTESSNYHTTYLVPLDTLKPKRVGEDEEGFESARFSPDGTRVLGVRGTWDKPKELGVFVADLKSGEVTAVPLPQDVHLHRIVSAAWSPGGKKVAVLWVGPNGGKNAPGGGGGKGSDFGFPDDVQRVVVLEVSGKNAETVRTFDPGHFHYEIEWANPQLTAPKKDDPKVKPPVKEPIKAPAPRGKDVGLIWLHDSKAGEVVGYAPDGTEAERWKLPRDQSFLGVTPDGTRILYETNGTYHLRSFGENTPGTDLGVRYNRFDRINAWHPDGTRFLKSQHEQPGKMVGVRFPEVDYEIVDVTNGTSIPFRAPENTYTLGWTPDGKQFVGNTVAMGKDSLRGLCLFPLPDKNTPSRPKRTPLTLDDHATPLVFAPTADGKTQLVGAWRLGPEEKPYHAAYRLNPTDATLTELMHEDGQNQTQVAPSPDGSRLAVLWEFTTKVDYAVEQIRLTVANADGADRTTVTLRDKMTKADRDRLRLLGWFSSSKIKAPVPKVKDESGFIWVYDPPVRELIAFTPDGREAKKVKLHDDTASSRTFYGISGDGRSALFAGIGGKFPPKGEVSELWRNGKLTLHRKPLLDDSPATDTGIVAAPADTFVVPPSGDAILHVTYGEPKDGGPLAFSATKYNADGKNPTPLALPDNMVILAVRPDGSLLLHSQSSSEAPQYRYWTCRPGGKPVRIAADLNMETVSASPDGTRLVGAQYQTRGTQPDQENHTLVSVNVATGEHRRIDEYTGTGFVRGFWSPDGRRVAVQWNRREEGRPLDNLSKKYRAGAGEVAVCDADGSNRRVVLKLADPGADVIHVTHTRYLLGWFPASQKIKAPVPKAKAGEEVLLISSRGGTTPFLVVSPDGKSKEVLPVPTGVEPAMMRVSPDGRWAAYGEPLTKNVKHVQGYFPSRVRVIDLHSPDAEPRTLMDETYGEALTWSADGKAVFVSRFDPSQLDAITAQKNGLIPMATTRVNLADGKETAVELPVGHRALAVSPDGQTWLTNTTDTNRTTNEAFIVTTKDGSVDQTSQVGKHQLATQFSADGQRALCGTGSAEPGQFQLASVEIATSKLTEVTLPDGVNKNWIGFARWSADGKRLAFAWGEPVRNRNGNTVEAHRVTVCDADGSNPVTVVELESGANIRGIDWMRTKPAKKDDPKAKPPVKEPIKAPVPKVKPPQPEKLDRPPPAPDELRKELAGWDEKYRHGSEEKFAELEKRATELAKEYDTDYNQARVWYAVAHIAGQSDIGKHADRVRKYAEKCLKLSRDPLDRGRLYSYLASCEEVAGGEFAVRRRKAADWLLKGYLELLVQELPDAKPDLPVVMKFHVVGEGPGAAQARAELAAQITAREQAVWVCDQIGRRDTLVLCFRNLYEPNPKAHGHGPDGPAELRKLAEAVLQTADDVDTLLERVLPGEKKPDVPKAKPPVKEPIKAPVPKEKEETMGLKASVTPEKKEFMLGEPTYFTFTVENPTDKGWGFDVGGDHRNRLGRPDSFEVTVRGADGKTVLQPDAGQSLGGILTGVKLPTDGTHTFTLFLPHWATFDKPGEYTLTVRRKLSLVPLDLADDERRKVKPEVATLSASAKIVVMKPDAKKFGDLIDTLGVDLLNPERAERATKMLLLIQDERVIPHFVKLSQLPRVEPRYAACEGLKKFKTGEAFAALKAMTATTGDDLKGSAVNRQLEESSARAVRHVAVSALTDCPHPDALPLVWKAVGDENDSVRLTVLHKAFEVKSAEARKIIEKLTEDADERVRNEAKRYAGLLAKEKK